MSSLHENKPSLMDIFINRPVLAVVLCIDYYCRSECRS